MAEKTAEEYIEKDNGINGGCGISTGEFLNLLFPVLISDASFVPAKGAPGTMVRTEFNAASVLYVRSLDISGDYTPEKAYDEIKNLAERIETEGVRKTAVEYYFTMVTESEGADTEMIVRSLEESDALLKRYGIISQIIVCNTKNGAMTVVSGGKIFDKKLRKAMEKVMGSVFSRSDERESMVLSSKAQIMDRKQALYPKIERHGPDPVPLLIVVNTVIFIAGLVIMHQKGVNYLVEAGIQDNELIAKGEVWRLFTCMFLHADVAHLAGNMLCLYVIGNTVRRFYTNEEIWTVYFGSGLAGNILGFFFLKARALGASGAIMGLGGLIFYRMIFGKEAREFVKAGNIAAVASTVLFNLVYGLFSEGIDNYGHFGGFVGGFLIAALIAVKRRKKEKKVRLKR